MNRVRGRGPWVGASLLGLAFATQAVLAIAGPRSSAEEAKALRTTATRLFRAKRFAAACPQFEAALRVAPNDIALLSDLALCQHRLGDDAQAREANLDLLGIASMQGDAEPVTRSRRNAYFNLAALAGEPRIPGGPGREQVCGKIGEEPGCTKSLYACSTSQSTGGSWVRGDTTSARIAITPDGAEFAENEIGDSPDTNLAEATFGPAPINVGKAGSLTYLAFAREEAQTYQCGDWSCESSPAVTAEVIRCKAKSTGHAICAEKVCRRAVSSPWAAVTREQRKIEDCVKGMQEGDTTSDCQLVYANGCTGLVGLVCTSSEGGRKPSIRVLEYRFERP